MITNDYKRYFLEQDGLNNIQNEIIFSLLKRYNCFAGCKVCYTQKDFELAMPEFNQFVPTAIDPVMEQEWFRVFDYFYCVSNIDDIFWMKHNQTHLYEWYLKHGDKFEWGNMTDNNFIRSQPLFLNEFTPETKIYEISFSSSWLNQINLDDIFSMLEKLHARNTIGKIKFIVDSEKDYEIPNVKKMYDWCFDRGLTEFGCSHHNFLGQTKNIQTDEIQIPQSHFCASDNGKLYNILGQSDYLQYDGLFLTLQESIDVNSKPYYQFSSFDPYIHMYTMMKDKIRIYKTWAEQYNKGLIKSNSDSKNHFGYFNWVANNVKVNNNYNYLPINLLRPNSKYFNKLKNENWIATELGLIKKDADRVVPLVEIING